MKNHRIRRRVSRRARPRVDRIEHSDLVHASEATGNSLLKGCRVCGDPRPFDFGRNAWFTYRRPILPVTRRVNQRQLSHDVPLHPAATEKLQDRRTGAQLRLDRTGAIIQEKQCDMLHATCQISKPTDFDSGGPGTASRRIATDAAMNRARARTRSQISIVQSRWWISLTESHSITW
jgi:hypothetical protein